MIESLQCRGFLSMVGALLITMGVGLMYLWGIISVYATSYYRIVTNDTNFTEFKADIVFPLQLLGQVTLHLSRLSPSRLLAACSAVRVRALSV